MTSATNVTTAQSLSRKIMVTKRGIIIADSGAHRNRAQMADEAIAKVLQNVRMDIAPYPVRFSLQFLDYDAKSGLGSKSLFFKGNAKAKAAFESGLKLAEKNQPTLACQQFRKAAGLFTGSPAIFHNLGACAELKQFDKAIAFYEQSSCLHARRLMRHSTHCAGQA